MIGLHLNLIFCTHWSGSIINIHVCFHLIETILNCEHVYILSEISMQIVAVINKDKSRCSVALQYNLAHGTVNHI